MSAGDGHWPVEKCARCGAPLAAYDVYLWCPARPPGTKGMAAQHVSAPLTPDDWKKVRAASHWRDIILPHSEST